MTTDGTTVSLLQPELLFLFELYGPDGGATFVLAVTNLHLAPLSVVSGTGHFPPPVFNRCGRSKSFRRGFRKITLHDGFTARRQVIRCAWIERTGSYLTLLS